MTFVEAIRRAIHCPVKGCGWTLAEVAGDGRATLWRICPHCGATIRYDLADHRFTIERAPRRRA